MKKPWTWLKEKAVAAKNFIADTLSTISWTIHFVSDVLREYDLFDFTQLWEGLTKVLHPSIVPALARSKKTRRGLKESFYANIILYMGSALLYESIKSFLRSTRSDFEDSYAESAMNMVAAWYFLRLAFKMLPINSIYNICVAKAASEENPINHFVEPCKSCGPVAVIRANIASFFNNLSYFLVINVVAKYSPVIGELLYAKGYGQALIEYALSEKCTEHRYDVLSKNNWYTFGFGLSLLLVYRFYSFLIKRLTGIDNAYVDNALFAFLFQYYILLTFVMDKPLPGTKKGIDFFYYVRLVMESATKQLSDFIIRNLKNPETNLPLDVILKKMNDSPLLNFLKKVMLDHDFQSLHRFVKSPAMELFLDLRGEEIQNVLESLIVIRKKPIAKRLLYISPYIPNFLLSKELKSILKLFLEKKLDGVLEEINHFITQARLKIKIYDPKRLEQILAEEANFTIKLPATPTTLVLAKQDEALESSKPLFIEDYKRQKPKTLNDDDWINVSTDKSLQKPDDLEDWQFVPKKNSSVLLANSLFEYKPADKKNNERLLPRMRF